MITTFDFFFYSLSTSFFLHLFLFSLLRPLPLPLSAHSPSFASLSVLSALLIEPARTKGPPYYHITALCCMTPYMTPRKPYLTPYNMTPYMTPYMTPTEALHGTILHVLDQTLLDIYVHNSRILHDPTLHAALSHETLPLPLEADFPALKKTLKMEEPVTGCGCC